MRTTTFRVVVATDGSRDAKAGVAVSLAFPWPDGATATAVVARRADSLLSGVPARLRAAVDREFDRVAADAARALRRRWPDAEVKVLDAQPVDGIVAAAPPRGGGAVVVGSRGHGPVGQWLLGSVSHGVVRRAACPVLVVRSRRAPITRLVVGIDGSANARHAVDVVARLQPPAGGHVTVVRVVEPLRPSSVALMPRVVGGVLRREVARVNAERRRHAAKTVEAAAARLRAAGWSARALVIDAVPLQGLLRAVSAARADCVVVGARGVGGVERLFLGSVARGLLSRCPLPVLVVR